MFDLPYPSKMTARNLESLSSAHGIINPHPHQALSDVIVMLQILAQYDFAEVERMAQDTNVQVRCFAREGEEKAVAKQLGFRWSWEDNSLIAEIKASQEQSFRTRILQYLPEAFDPIYRLTANVSYEKKDLAKEHGYRFISNSKKWCKTILKNDVDLEIACVKHLFEVHAEPVSA